MFHTLSRVLCHLIRRGHSKLFNSGVAVRHAGHFANVLAVLAALMTPGLASAGDVVVAPGSGATNVYLAPNGVPVVDIAKANGAGLSHNKYTQYNVNNNGLVLNNGNSSQISRQSQLAGQVPANLNLNQEARVILNEVVSTSRSALAGFTEVLGGKADVVVANPNGITCTGCGFINTDRATLTTGTPNIGADGSLSGFTVNRGDVLIGGAGANASTQQIFDIVARSVKVESGINSSETGSVGITTGTNTWSYADRRVSGAAAGSGAAPAFAVDSTVLGGMYAGRIRIIGTEAGVGVRMLGEAAASADDFVITSSGRIEIRSAVSAERDVKLTSTSAGGSGDIHVDGAGAKLSAKRDILVVAASGQVKLTEGELFAGNDLSLTAASLSDASAGSKTRFAGADNTLDVSGAADIDGGAWIAGEALSADAGSLSVGAGGATLKAGTTLDLDTTNDLALGKAAVQSVGDMTLRADVGRISTGAGANQGVQTTAGNLDLVAGNGLVNAGTMTSDTGSVTARVDSTLTNNGTLQARTSLDIADKAGGASEDIDNSGTLVSEGSLSLMADDISNSKDIQAATGTTVTAGNFTNSGSASKFLVSTASAANGSLTTSGAFDNQGLLQSAGALTVTAGTTLTNSKDIFALRSGKGGNNGALTLQADSIENTGIIDGGGKLTAVTGSSFINRGKLQGGGAILLDVGNIFTNQADAELIGDSTVKLTSGKTNFTLDNDGLLKSAGLMTLGEAGKLVSLDNAGTLQAGMGATVTGTTFTNSGAASKFLVSTTPGGDGSLTLSGAFNNQGIVQSAGGLIVNSDSTLTNSGAIKTTGGVDLLSLTGSTISNSGFMDGADLTTLTASATTGTTINNSGQVKSADTLSFITGGNLANTAVGKLLGNGALSITTPSAGFDLINDGVIESGATLTLGGSGKLVNLANNAAAVLFAGSGLDITGGTVNNQGKMTATSGMSLDLSGSLINGGIGNDSAVILGAADTGASLFTVGLLDNYGAIHSNDVLVIAASVNGSIKNRNTGGLSSLTTLFIAGPNIDNFGALYAGKDLSLFANNGSITNRAVTGTIDSGDTLTISSQRFTNNNRVVASGNVDISTSIFFTNETTQLNGVSITRTEVLDVNAGEDILVDLRTEGSAFSGLDATQISDQFSYQDTISAAAEAALTGATKAQILSLSGDVDIDYGQAGLNKAALISGENVNIAGIGTFTNESFVLYETLYETREISIRDETLCCVHNLHWLRTDPDASQRKFTNDNDEWDIYDPGSGWILDPMTFGDPNYLDWLVNGATIEWYYDNVYRAGATAFAPVAYKEFGAGIFAASFKFGPSGTLNNVGAPNTSSESQAKAGAKSGGEVTTESADGASAGVSIVSPTALASQGLPAAVIAGAPLMIAGLNLALPSNPNGFFVVSRDPTAGYLIEKNPLFSGASPVVGSDYMQTRYGYNPDVIVKRLGDAEYEAYLVRQQLISQTGSNVLLGYGSEVEQFQRLMDQALAVGDTLGFSYGKALTPSQVRGLSQDIVWMEQVVVAGQTVLTPRVYLAQSTRDMLVGGAVIAANSVDIGGDGLSNTGGTIVGNDTLKVNTTGDITNTSGTIRGGDVSLTSTEGSIINQTQAEGSGDAISYATVIGKRAGIEATGALDMDAKEDITVIGADVSAGGDAALTAGGEITFDTIVDKTTTMSNIDAGIGKESPFTVYEGGTTTSSTESNIGSSLTVGNKLTLNSGSDTTIAGSSVDVTGDLDAENIGGSLNIIARQDTRAITTEESTSGLGVGGGIYGTEKTTTETFTGTNVGSNLNVGGKAAITAADQFTVQGSDVDIIGKADIDARKGINILDGLDESRTTTVTETTTYLKGGGSSSSESDSDSDTSSNRGQGYATANASAEASAEAKANSDLKLVETTTATTTTTTNTSVASNFNVGGDLTATTEGTLMVQGSNVESGGDMTLDAKNVEVLAGRNETSTTTTSTSESIGMYSEASAGAGANAEANAKAGTVAMASGANADTSASANASAEGSATFGAQTVTENSSSYALTNTSSTLKSGGRMNITAAEDARFVGAEVESGGDMDIAATNIINEAAQDISYETSTRTTDIKGLYVDAKVTASADAGADAGKRKIGNFAPGAAHASGKVTAEASAGVRSKTTEEFSESGSVTQVTSSFKSGGNMTRTATDTIVDQGTQIEAGGNFAQTAREIRDIEASNSSFATTSSSSQDVKLGVGASARGVAQADTNRGATTGGQRAGSEGTGAGAGLRAKYDESSNFETSSSSTAVTTRYKAGGNITSTSTEKTTLIGTSFESGGDVELGAGSLDYQAARDTTSSSSSSDSLGVQAKLDVYGSDKGVTGSANYSDSSSSSSSSTARAGGINAGGNVKITTSGTAPGTGDAVFEGTNIAAGGKASIDATGSVDFKAARDTSTSSKDNVHAEARLANTKGGGLEGTAGGGYSGEESSSSTARVGGISAGSGGIDIKAGKDASFEGTKLGSEGDVLLDAKGEVNLLAAKSTKSSNSFGLEGDVGADKDHGVSSADSTLGVNFNDSDKVTSEVTSIKSSGGKVTINASGGTNQEAVITAKTGKEINAKLTNIKAESRDTSIGFEVTASQRGSRKADQPKSASGSKPADNAAPPPLRRAQTDPGPSRPGKSQTPPLTRSQTVPGPSASGSGLASPPVSRAEPSAAPKPAPPSTGQVREQVARFNEAQATGQSVNTLGQPAAGPNPAPPSTGQVPEQVVRFNEAQATGQSVNSLGQPAAGPKPTPPSTGQVREQVGRFNEAQATGQSVNNLGQPAAGPKPAPPSIGQVREQVGRFNEVQATGQSVNGLGQPAPAPKPAAPSTQVSTKTPEQKHDSVVVVLPLDKTGNPQDKVAQDAARAVVKRSEDKDRNVVLVQETAGGGINVVKGDLKRIQGESKVELVSHGKDLEGRATDMADVIKKIDDQTPGSKIARVNVDACTGANCGIGKDLSNALRGIEVAEYSADTKAHIDADGNKQVKNEHGVESIVRLTDKDGNQQINTKKLNQSGFDDSVALGKRSAESDAGPAAPSTGQVRQQVAQFNEAAASGRRGNQPRQSTMSGSGTRPKNTAGNGKATLQQGVAAKVAAFESGAASNSAKAPPTIDGSKLAGEIGAQRAKNVDTVAREFNHKASAGNNAKARSATVDNKALDAEIKSQRPEGVVALAKNFDDRNAADYLGRKLGERVIKELDADVSKGFKLADAKDEHGNDIKRPVILKRLDKARKDIVKKVDQLSANEKRLISLQAKLSEIDAELGQIAKANPFKRFAKQNRKEKLEQNRNAFKFQQVALAKRDVTLKREKDTLDAQVDTLGQVESAYKNDEAAGREKYRELLLESAANRYDQVKQAKYSDGKAKLYIGRNNNMKFDDDSVDEGVFRKLDDKIMTDKKAGQLRVMNPALWSPGINSALLAGAIEQRARIKFQTTFTPEARKLISESRSGDEFMKKLEENGEDFAKALAGKTEKEVLAALKDGAIHPDTGSRIKLIDPNLYNPFDGKGKAKSRYKNTVTSTEISQILEAGYVFTETQAADSSKGPSFQAFPSKQDTEVYTGDKERERINRSIGVSFPKQAAVAPRTAAPSTGKVAAAVKTEALKYQQAETTKPPTTLDATQVSTKTTEQKYDSVVVVLPLDKARNRQDKVAQDAALAVVKKNENKGRNVVLVQETEGGGIKVVKGDLSTIQGGSKVELVSHGKDLEGRATDMVDIVKKINDQTPDSKIARVNVDACAGANCSFGKELSNELRGIEVAEYSADTKAHIDADGNKQVKNEQGVVESIVRVADKNGNQQVDTKKLSQSEFDDALALGTSNADKKKQPNANKKKQPNANKKKKQLGSAPEKIELRRSTRVKESKDKALKGLGDPGSEKVVGRYFTGLEHAVAGGTLQSVRKQIKDGMVDDFKEFATSKPKPGEHLVENVPERVSNMLKAGFKGNTDLEVLTQIKSGQVVPALSMGQVPAIQGKGEKEPSPPVSGGLHTDRDDAGHLAMEANTYDHRANSTENAIAEQMVINQNYKRAFEEQARKIARENPKLNVVTIHEPISSAKEKERIRPVRVRHYIAVDGVIVSAITLKNTKHILPPAKPGAVPREGKPHDKYEYNPEELTKLEEYQKRMKNIEMQDKNDGMEGVEME